MGWANSLAPGGTGIDPLPQVYDSVLETPPSPLGRAVAPAISDIVAVGQGKIVPSGRTKLIQAFETGVVTTIAVEEGQKVAKGDLLVELDSTSTGADTDRLTKDLSRQALLVARLRSILGLAGGEVLDAPDDALTGFDPATLALSRSLRATQLGEQAEKLAGLARELERQRAGGLTAPVAGTVQQLQLHTIGGVVEPAKPLMVIVPEDAGIEIEAEIENKDIGFVREGQEAVVKLDAFPFTRYGTLIGHVVTISDDAVEQQSGNGQPPRLTYLARIRLETDTMNVDGRMVHLSPGMVAAAEIKTGTRKLIEFVLSPLMKMSGEAGRER